MRAEQTRSRDSATTLSPSPTMVKTTVPPRFRHQQDASTPSKATVKTRDTILKPPSGHNLWNICRTFIQAQVQVLKKWSEHEFAIR